MSARTIGMHAILGQYKSAFCCSDVRLVDNPLVPIPMIAVVVIVIGWTILQIHSVIRIIRNRLESPNIRKNADFSPKYRNEL
ncbi:MAG: hypothetical protein WAK50_12230 [Nitrososphaeraceae archaeon]